MNSKINSGAIIRAYSRALFNAIDDELELSWLAKALADLEALLAEPELSGFCQRLDLLARHKLAVVLELWLEHLDQAAGTGSQKPKVLVANPAIMPLLTKFIDLVAVRRHWALVPAIAKYFQELLDQKQNIIRVIVQAPWPVEAGLMSQLVTKLQIKYPDSRIITAFEQNPALIAGVKVLLPASEVWDLSLQAQMRKLAEALVS